MKRVLLLMVVLTALPLVAGKNAWTLTGPEGGRVALVLDPVDPDRLYAVVEGFIWRSTNRSLTWEKLNDGPPTIVGFLAIDPKNPLHLLVSGSSYNDPYYNDPNVYESTDGGFTWAAHRVGVFSRVGRIAFAGDGQTVYASGTWECFLGCVGGGVFRSNDRGHTFRTAGLQAQQIGELAVDQTNSDNVYATFGDGKSLGVRKTTNGGKSWSNVGPPYPITSIAIDPVVSSNIIAVSPSHALSISHDSGRTWTVHAQSSPSLADAACAVFNPAAHSTIYASMPSCEGCPPSGLPAEFLFGIVRSVDGGDTWSRFIDVNRPPDLGVLHVDASGKRLYLENFSANYEYTFDAEVPRRRAVQH